MGSERTNGTALDTVIIFTHQMEELWSDSTKMDWG